MCWTTKAAISLKRVKIEEKLLWSAYRKSPTLFRTIPFPTLTPPFPRFQVRNLRPKLHCYYIRNGKSYGFKFGQYIHRVHLRKSPLKIVEQGSMHGFIQGLSNFGGYSLLSQDQERVKLRTSNSVRTFTGSIGTKAH